MTRARRPVGVSRGSGRSTRSGVRVEPNETGRRYRAETDGHGSRFVGVEWGIAALRRS